MASVVVYILSTFPSVSAEGLWPVPAYSGDLHTRPALTGDWNGQRTDMAENGITVSVDNITSYQSIVDGGRNEVDEIGGSLDIEIHFDFEKMGLWPGAFVRIFAETQYGDFPAVNTGAALASNTDGIFPLAYQEETTLTSVIFYQFLSQSFGLYLGKLDTLDGDTNEFAGARGKTQFLNMNFVFNPVTLRTSPYSTLGGGFLYILPEDKGIFTFAVLDPSGQPDEAGFDDAFDDGTLYSVEARFNVNIAGYSGHQLLGATWSDKDYTLLDLDGRQLLLDLITTGAATPEKENNSWSIYYNFDQYFYTEEGDSEQGVGLFGRIGIADEETSPIDRFYSIGFGGKGIFAGRDSDTFGIGYFRSELSDDFLSFFSALDDSYGFEIFYNIEVTPWLHVTPDIQIIEPSLRSVDTAYVAGVRVKIDL